MELLDKQSMRILGIICFAIGSVILYAIGKRKFKRRTIAGTQVFRSYESSLFTKIIEGTLRLFALFLVLGGASALILSFE